MEDKSYHSFSNKNVLQLSKKDFLTIEFFIEWSIWKIKIKNESDFQRIIFDILYAYTI